VRLEVLDLRENLIGPSGKRVLRKRFGKDVCVFHGTRDDRSAIALCRDLRQPDEDTHASFLADWLDEEGGKPTPSAPIVIRTHVQMARENRGRTVARTP